MEISKDPILTIIIVNWNTREMLKNCLESIMKNQGNQNIKIIVVDNNSKDGSKNMIEEQFPEVKLINSGSNIGFGRANNLAIKQTNTPFVLFLNPDTIVMENTIDNMLKFMESQAKVGAIGCKMINLFSGKTKIDTDGEAQMLGLQWTPTPIKILIKVLFLSNKVILKLKKYLPYHDPNKSGYVSFLPGACLMVKKEVLERVGGFDERFFMYAEDYDLCRRIKEAGWELYYMSEVEIAHYVGGASEKATSQFNTLMMCQSISQLMEKYYGLRGKYLYKVAIFLGSFFRLFILIILKILIGDRMLPYGKSFKEGYKKYLSMFKWSLNLEKAKINE